MPDWNLIQETMTSVWGRGSVIWADGGWAMPPLAIIAFVTFAFGFHIALRLRSKRFTAVSERRWRDWIRNPEERRGPIGKLLDFAAGHRTLGETAHAFEQLRKTESLPFDRDLKVMKIFVGAAPLVGLLGTVTGMLQTFEGLAAGSGGDKTLGQIAEGIRAALVTTEAGLVVALPGLFLHHWLKRGHDRYKGFLAHLETVCVQSQYADQMQLEEQNRQAIQSLVQQYQRAGA